MCVRRQSAHTSAYVCMGRWKILTLGWLVYHTVRWKARSCVKNGFAFFGNFVLFIFMFLTNDFHVLLFSSCVRSIRGDTHALLARALISCRCAHCTHQGIISAQTQSKQSSAERKFSNVKSCCWLLLLCVLCLCVCAFSIQLVSLRSTMFSLCVVTKTSYNKYHFSAGKILSVLSFSSSFFLFENKVSFVTVKRRK